MIDIFLLERQKYSIDQFSLANLILIQVNWKNNEDDYSYNHNLQVLNRQLKISKNQSYLAIYVNRILINLELKSIFRLAQKLQQNVIINAVIGQAKEETLMNIIYLAQNGCQKNINIYQRFFLNIKQAIAEERKILDSIEKFRFSEIYPHDFDTSNSQLNEQII